MADIQYNIKTQVEDYDPNLWNAADANEVKTVVNMKADLTALQSEIDNRVNQQTDISNDIYDLQQTDISLQTQIDNISVGGGGTVDLTNYYTKLQSDSRFLSTGTTLFNGDYNSLINQPTIPSVTGLASETWVESQGYLTSFNQDFDYGSLTNKPDLSLKVDKVTGFSLMSDAEITRLSSVVNQDLNSLTAKDIDLQNQIDTLSTGGADLTNYYTKAQSDVKYISTGVTLFNGDYNSLSNKPDLSLKVDKSGTKVLTDVNFTTAMNTKLTGIATAATANDTDANLKNRANHTGSQAATTITQTASARFVTDTEKATWNAKVNSADITSFISNSTDTFGTKVNQIVSLTQAEYNGITPVATTFYIIV